MYSRSALAEIMVILCKYASISKIEIFAFVYVQTRLVLEVVDRKT